MLDFDPAEGSAAIDVLERGSGELVAGEDLANEIGGAARPGAIHGLTVVTSLPLDIDTSAKSGTYSLFCDLPPAGRVYGYRVTEF